jgi:hypothetical protein
MNPIKFIKDLFWPKIKRFKKYTVYRVDNDKSTLIICNYKKSDIIFPKEFANIECLLMPFNYIVTSIDLSELKGMGKFITEKWPVSSMLENKINI